MPRLSDDRAFERELAAMRPQVYAFARALTRNRHEDSEDLAQTALLKAWAARAQYQQGSNLRAWLFTICRNQFLTQCRRKKFDAGSIVDDLPEELTPRAPAGQEAPLHFADMVRALATLPTAQSASMIANAFGDSYEAIALADAVPVGTVKSRIGRGRAVLATALGGRF